VLQSLSASRRASRRNCFPVHLETNCTERERMPISWRYRWQTLLSAIRIPHPSWMCTS